MKRLALVATILVLALVVGALLIQEEATPNEPEQHAYVACSNDSGNTSSAGLEQSWAYRCIDIPHLGERTDWDCVGSPDDFDEARWCPPWAENHDLLWTVTFLEQDVTRCADATTTALTQLVGAVRGCLHLNATMMWHPGSDCAGLKDSFPDDPGGLYRSQFPAVFCLSVDYAASAWSTDSAGNVTFTTSLSPDPGAIGHLDHEHETTSCTWADPSPSAGDEVACDVLDAAAAQGTKWVPHVAAHVFELGTGANHVVMAQLAVEAPGSQRLVLDASATVEFFILGAG